MKMKTPVKILSATALCLTLIACKSVEERAEESYQSAISLAEAGDTDRAIVELRNVFVLNGSHREARWMLAQLLLNEKSNTQGAYSQLLRLAEQYPNDLEVRILLSQIAFEARDFDEFDRHGQAAKDLSPEDPRIGVIDLGRMYRDATVTADALEQDALIEQARSMLATSENPSLLRTIIADYSVRNGDLDQALIQIEALLELQPTNRRFYDQRLAILAELGETETIEAHLLDMVEVFEDDSDVKSTLLRFYLANNKRDEAENFLRSISSPADEDPSTFVDLIRFIAQTKGEDAALVEIERAIAENPDPTRFKALRASFWFADGREAEAIAEMEAVIAEAESSDILNSIKITLAQMLLSQENGVGARRLIEEVIADDQINAEALKMRAAWNIESDDVEQAISDLRLALDAEPEDSQAMTLMSQAYARQGSHELSLDFLSLAADASNNAPEESLRYAAALMREEQYLPAEDTLIASLRLNAGNELLLGALGRVYLAMEDEPRLQQVINTLRATDAPGAIQTAIGLEADMLSLREGSEEALAFLEQLASSEDSGLSSQLFLLRGRISTGDYDGARNLLEALLQDNPDSIALRSVGATIDAVSGDHAAAEASFRLLLEDDPTIARNWLELSRMLMIQGKQDESRAAIEDGLKSSPTDPSLLWAKASILEQSGDVDGAIEVYEGLYAANSGAPVIANNLASLLATYRSDEESLERAYVIARRLQGTEVPQFQDTIGWILHRRGKHEEALTYLERSAAALKDDPIAQYHLGMVQSALGMTDAALEHLQSAVSIAGPDDAREHFLKAREEIVRLQNQ